MEAVLLKNRVPWGDRYGQAWAKIRNPMAHGDHSGIDQTRVDHFHIATELWNIMVLGEIGYEGTVVRYGSTGHSMNYPSSLIGTAPTHLADAGGAKSTKIQKKTKSAPPSPFT
jgi:hypothetical protein